MYKYVIMGIQGCGKGTQARLLCNAYDFVHISVGDQFRWHISNHTQLAAKINRIVSSGQLVGDDLVNKVVAERLALHDWNYGFVLDGFPRNFAQAEFLFENYNLNTVIHMEAPDDVITERMMARRSCSGCGRDYNLLSSPPAIGGVCDACGGSLIQRSDDHPEAIRKRIADYRAKTEPLLKFFRRLGIVLDVNAMQSIDKVHDDIRKGLGLPKKQHPLNSLLLPSEREPAKGLLS